MAEPLRPNFTPSPDLFPFESRWFESSVGPIHYIDETPPDDGSGHIVPTILFFHGNPTWSFLYRHIVRSLRDEIRCIAFDYPGFGLSVRPRDYRYTPGEHARVALELVDHLGLEDFSVMGQDWGGPIGMWVASERPGRIHALIFGNTWAWPADDRRACTFSIIMSLPPLQWALRRWNFFVRRMMPIVMRRKLSAQEKYHYEAVQPRGQREGIAAFPREIRAAQPWLDQLAIRVIERMTGTPLLLVWGMKDIGFKPSKYIPTWQETFTNHRLVELPKAKHYIQEDAPDEIADAIRTFISERWTV